MKKIINRKASYNYQLLERFEAGLVLTGAEVKSVRAGRLQLEQSFVRLIDRQAYLINALIHPYLPAHNQSYQPRRTRKLLLHKAQLLKLSQQTKEKGLTVVPVSCYTKAGKIKLEIALAKPKKKYQKREAVKKRDLEKEVRALGLKVS